MDAVFLTVFRKGDFLHLVSFEVVGFIFFPRYSIFCLYENLIIFNDQLCMNEF